MPDEKIEDDATLAATESESSSESEDQEGDDAIGTSEESEVSSDGEEWSEEDLRLLSDEERAALFDDDSEGGDDAVNEGEDPNDPAEAAAADDTAADDADQEPVTGTQTADIDSLEGQVKGLDDQIEALDTAKTDAFDSWEDGDLTREEYLDKIKEIDAEARKAVSEKVKAETNLEAAVEQKDKVYNSFIDTAKSYFAENPELASDAHAQAYDHHVRAVTGNERYQHMTHRQMLEAAHRLYVAEADVLGIEVPAYGKAKAEPEPKPTPKPPEPPKRKRAGDKAPVTLANMPNAQNVSVSDGKYSALAQRLENADAVEYERIMGSMSADEAEAFASMDV